MTKSGIELYYQHLVVNDGIRGKVNVAMSKTMSDIKDQSLPFCKYLKNKKVYVTHAYSGLIDSRIIGVLLQTDLQLSFCNDIKASISNLVRDGAPLSVFAKCVRELNSKYHNPHFTNGLAIQVAIKDAT
jgi:hypothetical protein